MSRTAFTLLITCVLTLIASTKGYLGAAEPSEPETAETTQSSSRKTLLSLSGGGMFAHTTHSGIIKGMLDNSYPRGDLRSTGYQWGNAINARYAGTAPAADSADLAALFGNVKAITANSGGTWLMTQLAFYPKFQNALLLHGNAHEWNGLAQNEFLGQEFELGYLSQLNRVTPSSNGIGWPISLLYDFLLRDLERFNAYGNSWKNMNDFWVFEPWNMFQEPKGIAAARNSWAREIDLYWASGIVSHCGGMRNSLNMILGNEQNKINPATRMSAGQNLWLNWTNTEPMPSDAQWAANPYGWTNSNDVSMPIQPVTFGSIANPGDTSPLPLSSYPTMFHTDRQFTYSTKWDATQNVATSAPLQKNADYRNLSVLDFAAASSSAIGPFASDYVLRDLLYDMAGTVCIANPLAVFGDEGEPCDHGTRSWIQDIMPVDQMDIGMMAPVGQNGQIMMGEPSTSDTPQTLAQSRKFSVVDGVWVDDLGVVHMMKALSEKDTDGNGVPEGLTHQLQSLAQSITTTSPLPVYESDNPQLVIFEASDHVSMGKPAFTNSSDQSTYVLPKNAAKLFGLAEQDASGELTGGSPYANGPTQTAPIGIFKPKTTPYSRNSGQTGFTSLDSKGLVSSASYFDVEGNYNYKLNAYFVEATTVDNEIFGVEAGVDVDVTIIQVMFVDNDGDGLFSSMSGVLLPQDESEFDYLAVMMDSIDAMLEERPDMPIIADLIPEVNLPLAFPHNPNALSPLELLHRALGGECPVGSDTMYPGECGCHLAEHWGGTTSLTDRNLDDDGDGIPNCSDQCWGLNDLVDNNSNGIPDGCEEVVHTYPQTTQPTLVEWINSVMLDGDNLDERKHIFEIPLINGNGASLESPITWSQMGGTIYLNHPNRQIVIRPQDPNGTIVLDAEFESRHLYFVGETLEVERIVFVNGRISDSGFKTYGGSVFIDHYNESAVEDQGFGTSKATFKQCFFENNVVQIAGQPFQDTYAHGGAICSFGQQLNLIQCSFVDNQALPDWNDFGADPLGIGGAVSVLQSDQVVSLIDNALIVFKCYFEGNEAYRGGAVHCYKRPMEIYDSYFVDNKARSRGGALYAWYENKMLVRKCTFLDNTSVEGYGDAIYRRETPFNAADCSTCEVGTEILKSDFCGTDDFEDFFDLGSTVAWDPFESFTGNRFGYICDYDNDGLLWYEDQCPGDYPDTDGDGYQNCVDICPDDPEKIQPGLCGCGVAETDTDGDDLPDCVDPCPLGHTSNDDDNDGIPNLCDPDYVLTYSPEMHNAYLPLNEYISLMSDGTTLALAPGLYEMSDWAQINSAHVTIRSEDPAEPATLRFSSNIGFAVTYSECALENIILEGTAEDDTGLVSVGSNITLQNVEIRKWSIGANISLSSFATITDSVITSCPTHAIVVYGSTSVKFIDSIACGNGFENGGLDQILVIDTESNFIDQGGNCITDVCDSDLDGTLDCDDNCPDDPAKTEPGVCGCGVAETDSDLDGTQDCVDACPDDPEKTEPGECGCDVAETDSDLDGTPDCVDACPNDPDKVDSGSCGCGFPETDDDEDGVPDCEQDSYVWTLNPQMDASQIQQIIDNALPGHAILFASDGLAGATQYGGSFEIDTAPLIVIGEPGVTIRPNGGPAFRVNVQNGSENPVTFMELTIQGPGDSGSGGNYSGLEVLNGSAIALGVTIHDCVAAIGGAVRVHSGARLGLVNCVLYDNIALEGGGGAHVASNGELLIEGTIICANAPDQIAGEYLIVDDPTTEETCISDMCVMDDVTGRPVGCEPTALCPQDLDGDGTVGPQDLTILLAAWGESGPGDLDEDGVVGPQDLTILLGAWNCSEEE
ncbi:MAG: hypothetical protein CMJ33_08445 [Phycisphaerae bacterium]|nr:hypothetical protein [Phycisphaerae bacterium]